MSFRVRWLDTAFAIPGAALSRADARIPTIHHTNKEKRVQRPYPRVGSTSNGLKCSGRGCRGRPGKSVGTISQKTPSVNDRQQSHWDKNETCQHGDVAVGQRGIHHDRTPGNQTRANTQQNGCEQTVDWRQKCRIAPFASPRSTNDKPSNCVRSNRFCAATFWTIAADWKRGNLKRVKWLKD